MGGKEPAFEAPCPNSLSEANQFSLRHLPPKLAPEARGDEQYIYSKEVSW
jgi:hypothetical protein